MPLFSDMASTSYAPQASKNIVQWDERKEILEASFEVCQRRLRIGAAYPHLECETPSLEERARKLGYAGYKRMMSYFGKIQEIERDFWSTSGKKPAVYTEEMKQSSKELLLQPSQKRIQWEITDVRPRVLINSDISNGIEVFPISIYSDILNSVEPPEPSNFKYLRKNIIPDEIKQDAPLKRQCECENMCDLNCSCVQADCEMNEKFGYDPRTNRFYLQPIYEKNIQEQQFVSARIMCGPSCGCSVHCPFRFENLVKVNKYEICKNNSIMGFSLRSLTNIREGEPILEFIGEIILDETVEEDWSAEEQQCFVRYAHELSDPTQYKLLKKKLKDIFQNEVTDDQWRNYKTRCTRIFPYHKGNVGRFLQHSCTPNAVILRVVTNDLRFEKHHLLVLACANIVAGDEITIDYGRSYFDGMQCLCESILCDSQFELWRPLLDGYQNHGEHRRIKPKNPKNCQNTPVLSSKHPIFNEALDVMEAYYKNEQLTFDRKIDEFSKEYPTIKNFKAAPLKRKAPVSDEDSSDSEEQDFCPEKYKSYVASRLAESRKEMAKKAEENVKKEPRTKKKPAPILQSREPTTKPKQKSEQLQNISIPWHKR